MTIPREAIDKAISGGWLGGNWDTYNNGGFDWQHIVLDPTFWQALGKALGWGTNWNPTVENDQYLEEWYDTAHRFYDLILQGQPTNQFWADLGITSN